MIKTTFIFLLLALISSLNGYSQCNSSFSYAINPAGNVSFTNLSTTFGTATYYWSFGNYRYSQLANPSNTYDVNGNYTVNLSIRDSIAPGNVCLSTSTMSISITNTACINANFTYYVGANGSVTFTNTTANIIPNSTFYWNLGNGNTSTNIAPSTTYTASGNYTVALTVNNSASCSNTYTSVITVSVQPCNLTSSFTYTLMTNGYVGFTNTSSGTSPTSNYSWDFGDGNFNFSQSPPPKSYLFNGLYTVTLNVYDSVSFRCSSSLNQTVNIINAPCYSNSNFSMYKDSSQIPLVVWNAYPQYPSNIISATWAWGDGTSSSSLYPSHTYSATGLYNICLTVSVSCGTSSTTCLNANIYKINSTNIIGTINVKNVSVNIPEYNDINDFKLFPSPALDELNFFTSKSEFYKVIAYDLTGKLVATEFFELGKSKMNISHLSNGLYLYTVTGKNNQVLTTGKFNVSK